MTELERKALMGDEQAQEECTRQGIVLPCPFCGSEWTQVRRIGWENTPSPFKTGYRGECTVCYAVSEAYITREEALSHWNTRPAPPIGRCAECVFWCKGTSVGEKCACQWLSTFCTEINTNSIVYTESDDFCSQFEMKGSKDNEA